MCGVFCEVCTIFCSVACVLCCIQCAVIWLCFSVCSNLWRAKLFWRVLHFHRVHTVQFICSTPCDVKFTPCSVPYIFSQCIVKLMYPPICSLPGNSECPQCSLCYSVLTVVKNTVSAFRWAQSRLCNWELLAGAFKQMMMMRQKFDKWRKHILPDIRICRRSWKVWNFAFSVKFWYLDSFKASIICCLKNKEKNQSKLKTFLHLR